jgi:hypothetical protein
MVAVSYLIHLAKLPRVSIHGRNFQRYFYGVIRYECCLLEAVPICDLCLEEAQYMFVCLAGEGAERLRAV